MRPLSLKREFSFDMKTETYFYSKKFFKPDTALQEISETTERINKFLILSMFQKVLVSFFA